MKLYTCRGAPHPARVQLYLAEKVATGAAISVHAIEVDLKHGQHRTASHLARNMAGTVPVLEVGDGLHITESLAIIDYLEDLFPVPSLWGGTPFARARQRELDRIAELRVLRPVAQWVHATNSPLGRSPDPEAAKRHDEIAGLGLAQIEDALADGRPFLGGESCSVADCTLAAGLDFGLKRGFELPAGASSLARWCNRFWARSSAIEHLRWRPA